MSHSFGASNRAIALYARGLERFALPNRHCWPLLTAHDALDAPPHGVAQIGQRDRGDRDGRQLGGEGHIA